ncbi:hypothetical protein L6164_033194 [Bauhinia variegata]|uniref:Uncharacterized protein n=1 Tax=Bauhinia variegata TaxID=167791 RepID=A0ACB9KR27_BAUVA|nr:hypothetical protein L6164_033194 [Bauhinia variegata]
MDYIREELAQPVSPMGQCFNSSVMCINVLAVLELKFPLMTCKFHLSLEMSSFLSTHVSDKNGKKIWKQVEVKLEEHIIIPKFPNGMSMDSYEDCFNDYISSIAMEQLPQNKPLWQIHEIIYPTSKSAGTL